MVQELYGEVAEATIRQMFLHGRCREPYVIRNVLKEDPRRTSLEISAALRTLREARLVVVRRNYRSSCFGSEIKEEVVTDIYESGEVPATKRKKMSKSIGSDDEGGAAVDSVDSFAGPPVTTPDDKFMVINYAQFLRLLRNAWLVNVIRVKLDGSAAKIVGAYLDM